MIPELTMTVPIKQADGLKLNDELNVTGLWEDPRVYVVTEITWSVDGTATIKSRPKERAPWTESGGQ